MTPAGLAVAAILTLAAALKIGGMPGSMLRAMRDLALPSQLMSPSVAWAHLAAQVAVAAGLLLPAPASRGASLAAVLLASTYLALVVSRRGMTCRCLSQAPRPIGPVIIARNVFFLALSAATLLPPSRPAAALAAALTAGFAALEVAGRRGAR